MEWISVKDRLPKSGEFVLIFFPRDSEPVSCGYYDPGETHTAWRDDEYLALCVTHWMPLPKPPEEDAMD